jgi:hypothetical protein
MKKTKLFLPILIFSVAFLGFNSCNDIEKEESNSTAFEVYNEFSLNEAEVINSFMNQFKSTDAICEIEVFPLIAGQFYYAGHVEIYNDDSYLYVTLVPVDDCVFSDMSLYVGTLENVPVNKKGTPVPGHFPFKENYLYGNTFKVPLSEVTGCTILVHAVCCEETIWAMDPDNVLSFENVFGVTRWGWVIEDCIDDCDEPEMKYFYVKSFTIDDWGNKNFWVSVNEGEQIPETSNWKWCTSTAINLVEDGATHKLTRYYDQALVGNVDISVDASNVTFTLTFDDAVVPSYFSFYETSLFYGTMAEFDDSMTSEGCPDYTNPSFFILNNDIVRTKVIVVPK